MKPFEKSFKFAFYFNILAFVWNIMAGVMSISSQHWNMLVCNIIFTITSGICVWWVRKTWKEFNIK